MIPYKKYIGWGVCLCAWATSFLLFASCHKRLGPTTIRVEDSVRHYPPVILGEDIDLVYVLHNTGDEVLAIIDVQPSCPTIETTDANITTVPPGKEVVLKFVFHSDKNMGYTQHSIRLFGNIAPKGVAELVFDTRIVRPSIDLSDYEEYYQEELRSTGKKMMDASYKEYEYGATEGDYTTYDAQAN